ncbi:hypothetical protein KSZ_40420 [Dictyobacter formicarum]|uniref:Uncharacterized protein n=1 Tax=Dictyobacter formicarum TaxID=2778368 RepID=A0ABQ3VKX8_9CHLR|nr:hypothetical protein KSZ_40420 [Dictyobacter formicarum]
MQDKRLLPKHWLRLIATLPIGLRLLWIWLRIRLLLVSRIRNRRSVLP